MGELGELGERGGLAGLSAMGLWHALGVCPGDVVALTGGGGKTSLALALVDEGIRRGQRCIFATTTKILTPPYPTVHLPGHPPAAATPTMAGAAWALAQVPALQAVYARLAERLPVALTAGPADARTGKLPGVEPDWIDRIKAWGWADLVAVEADGSNGRPLKAPAAHEPVIPAATDVVVAVAGATVLGRPLADAWVHRPERVAALTGLRPGDTITAAAVARCLLDPAAGCLKGLPPGARAVVVVNQADALPAGTAAPTDLVSALTAEGRRHWQRTGAGRFVLAAARTDRPVRGRFGDVAALLLCAGESRRFGAGHKLLVDLGGRTVVARSAAGLVRSGVREVVAVTGARAEAVAAALSLYPVTTVHNPEYHLGMAHSVQRGLAAVFPGGAGDPAAFLFCMGDQPLLGPAQVRRLVQVHYDTGAPIVVPVAGGRRRHPVLFARRLVPELREIRGDEGGRRVLQAHAAEVLEVHFDDPLPFADVDTPEQMQSVADALGDLPETED